MSEDRYDRALAKIYGILNRPTHAAFILQERASVAEFLYSQDVRPFAFENLDDRVVNWYRSIPGQKLPKALPQSVQLNLMTCLRMYGKRNLSEIPVLRLYQGTSALGYTPKRSRTYCRRRKRSFPAE